VYEFLKGYDIKRGTTYIEQMLVYRMFEEWLAKRTRIKMGFLNFVTIAFNALNVKTVNKISYFGINQNLRETYITPQKEKQFLRKQHKNGKKTVSKRQAKVRSTRPAV
jgi:hypothetical protein